MQGHPGVIEQLALVATSDDNIVGCVMGARARIILLIGDPVEVLEPGPVAVSTAQQNHGIGTVLLQGAFDRAC